jgi:hypothetical protein
MNITLSLCQKYIYTSQWITFTALNLLQVSKSIRYHWLSLLYCSTDASVSLWQRCDRSIQQYSSVYDLPMWSTLCLKIVVC